MNKKDQYRYDLEESASMLSENDLVENNEEIFSIPDESSCSPEFSQGCIFIEQ